MGCFDVSTVGDMWDVLLFPPDNKGTLDYESLVLELRSRGKLTLSTSGDKLRWQASRYVNGFGGVVSWHALCVEVSCPKR
jgi:hypothetical protein